MKAEESSWKNCCLRGRWASYKVNALEYVVGTNVVRLVSAGIAQAAHDVQGRCVEEGGENSWTPSTKEGQDSQQGTRNSTEVWTIGSWLESMAS